MWYRAGKEYDRTKFSANSQKEKLEENFKRESEQCIARRSDLNLQLEDMQRKLKVKNFLSLNECSAHNMFVAFPDGILMLDSYA